MRKTFKLLLKVTLTVTISAFLIVSLIPEQLALIFNDDPELVELTGRMMPIFFGGIWAFWRPDGLPVRLYGHGPRPKPAYFWPCCER